MSDSGQFGIRMQRTSYKSQNLIYDEPGFELVVYLEMSGIKEFDWVGCDTSFLAWTAPANESIPDTKRAQIRSRLNDWASAQNIRLQFGPPMDMKAYFSELQAKGHSIEYQPDGTVLLTPRKRGTMLQKFRRFLGSVFRS
jgi:hypothetical protein